MTTFEIYTARELLDDPDEHEPTSAHPASEHKRFTWRDLLVEEPELAGLEREVRAIRRSSDAKEPHFCANAAWYGYCGWRGIKPRLFKLVGWEAQNPALRSRQAWDVAYQHLYDLLPGCRDCICF